MQVKSLRLKLGWQRDATLVAGAGYHALVALPVRIRLQNNRIRLQNRPEIQLTYRLGISHD